MEYIYAALLLHKLGKPIDADSLEKVINAAGAQVDEAKVKTLVAALKGVDIAAEMEKSVVASNAGAGEAKKEEKKEEEKPSESAAGLASLFG